MVATTPLVSPPGEMPPTNVARVRPLPNFDLGAGVLFGGDSLTGSSVFYGATPAYRMSAEWRIHGGTWLSFTGGLTHASSELPISSQLIAPTRTVLHYQTTSAAALLGVRQVLLKDIVELSWFGALVGGWSWVAGDVLQPGESAGLPQDSMPGAKTQSLGFTSGIALERELVERLSVRLSSELVTAVWSQTTTPADSTNASTAFDPDTKRHSQTTAVRFAPALDLRFYF